MSQLVAERDSFGYGLIANSTLSSTERFEEWQEPTPLGDAFLNALSQWEGRSYYVTRLIGRLNNYSRPTRSLSLVVSILVGGVTVTALAVQRESPLWFLVGAMASLWGYGGFWGWVAANKYHSPLNWYLERIRRCLSDEGDPGERY